MRLFNTLKPLYAAKQWDRLRATLGYFFDRITVAEARQIEIPAEEAPMLFEICEKIRLGGDGREIDAATVFSLRVTQRYLQVAPPAERNAILENALKQNPALAERYRRATAVDEAGNKVVSVAELADLIGADPAAVDALLEQTDIDATTDPHPLH